MKATKYTLTVFTENRSGLLSRIAMLFTRRRINIESITVSESEVEGVHRYTIVIATSLEQAQRVTAQLLKLVDVLQVFMYDEDEIICQELALFKIRNNVSDNSRLRELLASVGGRVLEDGRLSY
jgi:acetolactate synthase-1/3 small subunit